MDFSRWLRDAYCRGATFDSPRAGYYGGFAYELQGKAHTITTDKSRAAGALEAVPALEIRLKLGCEPADGAGWGLWRLGEMLWEAGGGLWCGVTGAGPDGLGLKWDLGLRAELWGDSGKSGQGCLCPLGPLESWQSLNVILRLYKINREVMISKT